MLLRVGLIGAGHVCAYADAFKQTNSCTVAALCALPTDARRTSAVKTHTIPALYDDVHRMLDKEHLDIVVVGSPPAQHRAHVCAALEAGAHVLCEKPPATTLADAEACYFRALYCDRHWEVGLCGRHLQNLPPPRPHLSSVHVRWLRTTASEAAWARDTAISGGGVLADLCHAVDAGLYALGDPLIERVRGTMHDASGQVIQTGAEDTFGGLLECAGGRRISLEISWAADRDEQLLLAYGDAPHAPPHSGRIEDKMPLIVDDNVYWRIASQFIHHCYVSNRARQLDISHRAVVLQEILGLLYQSACAGGVPVRFE